MIKPNNYVIPIEVLLELDASVLRSFFDQLKKCGRVNIVTDPGIVLVEKDSHRSNIVIGTGSIVLSEASCISSVYYIDGFEPIKNEWVNTCTITPNQFLIVKMDDQNDVIRVKDVILTSLTNKMIYPRVFNGLKIRNVSVPGKDINGNVEWIMSDSKLRYPVVYFNRDNIIHVSMGSEEMYRLLTLLSLEVRCSQYRLIVLH